MQPPMRKPTSFWKPNRNAHPMQARGGGQLPAPGPTEFDHVKVGNRLSIEQANATKLLDIEITQVENLQQQEKAAASRKTRQHMQVAGQERSFGRKQPPISGQAVKLPSRKPSAWYSKVRLATCNQDASMSALSTAHEGPSAEEAEEPVAEDASHLGSDQDKGVMELEKGRQNPNEEPASDEDEGVVASSKQVDSGTLNQAKIKQVWDADGDGTVCCAGVL